MKLDSVGNRSGLFVHCGALSRGPGGRRKSERWCRVLVGWDSVSVSLQSSSLMNYLPAIFTAVLVSLFALVLALFVYVGAFHRIEVAFGTTSFKCLHIRYKLHVSSLVGNVSHHTEKLIEELQLNSGSRRQVRICYIYYDNPDDVKRKYGTDSFCRWVIAVAVDDKEREALSAEDFEAFDRELENLGFKPFVVQGGEVIRCLFPIKRNRLLHALNRTIRIQQVFPLIFRFVEHKSLKILPVVELYCDGLCETVMARNVKHGLAWFVEEASRVAPSKVHAALQQSLAKENLRAAIE